jgi:hypothetical protein
VLKNQSSFWDQGQKFTPINLIMPTNLGWMAPSKWPGILPMERTKWKSEGCKGIYVGLSISHTLLLNRSRFITVLATLEAEFDWS